jgi:hypothetical protein
MCGVSSLIPANEGQLRHMQVLGKFCRLSPVSPRRGGFVPLPVIGELNLVPIRNGTICS